MKSLYLIRHAKSDWDSPDGSDHGRPLARRGIKSAKLMGRWLAAAGEIPEAVVVPSAVRAHTTVQLMAEADGWQGVHVRVTPALYESRPETVLEEVKAQDDAAASLLLAGHEPTSSTLVGALTAGSRVRMVTAALVRIDFEVSSWSAVAFRRGTLIWMMTPRLLQATGWAPE